MLRVDRQHEPVMTLKGSEFPAGCAVGIEAATAYAEYAAIRLLSEVGGGATALPPCEGAWSNDQTDELVWENPVIVYTYIKPDLFAAALPRIRSWLYRLGRETNQGEIAFEFKDKFFRIRTFDLPDQLVLMNSAAPMAATITSSDSLSGWPAAG
jgi:hypothetical protein